MAVCICRQLSGVVVHFGGTSGSTERLTVDNHAALHLTHLNVQIASRCTLLTRGGSALHGTVCLNQWHKVA